MVLGGVVGDRAEPITQRQKYDYMVLYGHKTRINPMLRKNKLIPATNDWGKKKKKLIQILKKRLQSTRVRNFFSNILTVNTVHFITLSLVTFLNVGQWHNAKMQFIEVYLQACKFT